MVQILRALEAELMMMTSSGGKDNKHCRAGAGGGSSVGDMFACCGVIVVLVAWCWCMCTMLLL